MSKVPKTIFVSLYWKAASGLAVIFLALISVFTYFNAEQLKNLQTHHRVNKQHQFIVEYNGLLKKTELQLISVIDSLPNYKAGSGTQSLRNKIEQNWSSLQITWAIESAVLIDQKGIEIQSWGDKRMSPRPETLQRTLSSGAPVPELICFEDCQLAVSSPVLSEGGEIQLLQLSVSLADTMLDFQRITGSDIGILTRAKRGGATQNNLGRTGYRFSALTNRVVLQPLINKFSLERSWGKSFLKGMSDMVFVLKTSFTQYELLLLSSAELETNNAMVIFISDTTSAREQIQLARQAYIITGLMATLIALALIVLVLWRPIRSLQRQSRALPLLARGEYKEAKERLQGMAKNRIFADEISNLQETSIEVTEQLENYHKKLTRNTQKLYEMAHFDTLTGLTNRAYLTEIIEQKFNSDDSDENEFALIYLDLDNFKHINDALGHVIGDNLLIVIAMRLKSCIGPNDYAARMGGDEFCIVLQQVHSESYAIDFAKKILKIMDEPVAMEGRNLAVTTSIGITLSSIDGTNADALLQNADLAMYQAKAAGKNNFHVFNAQLHKDADSRMALDVELRKAVENEEFVLFYQPQVNLKTGELIGCEALIRWEHPARGLLAPFFFIDTIESNGLIIPVGKWVIQEACRQCGEWARKGLDNLKISINLSTRQFSDPGLIDDIKDAIAKENIHPSQLEFEVTESLLATDIKHAIDILNELQSIGLTIAIDDFGTGYSSLSYLKQLPLDKLKIDRAFIMDIPENNDDMQITAAIIAMAHTLNLKVVAEGVESKAQMAFLQGLNCEIGQGYLFNKPISAEQFERLSVIPGSFEFYKQ